MILTYKHIQNKIHALNNICKDNGYTYISKESDPSYLNALVENYELAKANANQQAPLLDNSAVDFKNTNDDVVSEKKAFKMR